MPIYQALHNNNLPVIQILAPNVQRALLEAERQLDRPGRRSYLNAWKRNDRALRDKESGIIYDTIEVYMPSDVTEDPEERIDLIILNAREEAANWASPCEWRIIEDTGEAATVRRLRRK